MEEIKGTVKKTTENIRTECETILVRYFEETESDKIISNSTAVTDSGSNIINLFPNRRPCVMCNDWKFNERPIPTSDVIEKKSARGKPIPPKKLFNVSVECPKN